MADSGTAHWHPVAAYLYVLHLDGPALAWEYLRRNPDYRQDWRYRHRRPDAAHRWGLRLLEDPALDARDGHPAWFLDHDTVIQVYADADPPPGALPFEFWRLPGRKHLVHDGKRLLLFVRWPGSCLRLALLPGQVDGAACVYAVRARANPYLSAKVLAHELKKLASAGDAVPVAVVWPRPSLSPLQERLTLRALDANLSGASVREVAEGLFGTDAVAQDWHADGALRARTRRLVRRGRNLMRGGYRHLAQLPVPVQGRSSSRAKRP